MKKFLHYDKVCGSYFIKLDLQDMSLNLDQFKELKIQENNYRANILKNKSPKLEQWEKCDDIKTYCEKIFYIKQNDEILILKKSLELYKKYGTGLFWIGDENVFQLSEKEYYNSLYTYSLHFLKDFSLEINYNDNKWFTFDAKKYLNFDSFEEFIQMNHYGYGGLIWNNGFTISHEFIYNNSMEGRNENKIFCDDCNVEIVNEYDHECYSEKKK